MKTTDKIAVATAMFILAVLLGAMAVWTVSENQFVQAHIFRATVITACWTGVILIGAIWVAIKKRLCMEEDLF